MKTRICVPSYRMLPIDFSVVYRPATQDDWLSLCTGIFARVVMGTGLLTFSLFTTFFFPSVSFSTVGAEWNPTGNPIGGGPGYCDSVRHQDADYFVSTKSELLSALANATAGDIVYINDNAVIDMDGATGSVPSGVTLASGRGRTLGDTTSWGALLYFDSIGISQWHMFQFVGNKGGRITGLRLRGAYSQLEGRPSKTYSQPVVDAGVCIMKDSSEVDNCEMWGFGYTGVYCNHGVGSYVHHNYFHHGSHVSLGYGFCNGQSGQVVLEANRWDHHGGTVAGGPETTSKYEARYNITGPHSKWHAFDRHGSGNQAAADYIHHNTVMNHGYYVSGYHGYGYPVDSLWIHNNWFWADDSASAIAAPSDSMCRFWDNHYTTIPPTGVSGRMPVANITVDTDSGSSPLTVTFRASGSHDPDGEILAYYWDFGDSSGVNNNARYTDINDSVQHTYNEIGVYRVELMVTDNDGIPSYDYVEINIAPTDGHNWLSFWEIDNNYTQYTGYFAKQMFVDNWLVWEEDIAGGDGDETWEHVLIDITDSLVSKDSVTLTYRLYCKRDSSEYWEPRIFIDDVVLYGCDIVNGNFEMWDWMGTNRQTDGYWYADGSNHYYCHGFHAVVHSGIGSYNLLHEFHDPIYQGDYASVSQKVVVNGAGIIPSSNGMQTCSLYIPYPNPARVQTQFGYKIDSQNKVLLNIYDVSGRFVRNIVESTQMPGEYDMMWDGKDYAGKNVANGVYFLRFNAGNYEETKQIVWLR